MSVYKVADRLGGYLLYSCVLYACFLGFMITNIYASIVPDTGDSHTGPIDVILSLVLIFFLGIVVPVSVTRMTTTGSIKSHLLKRGSWVPELIMLILSIAGLANVILQSATVISGDAGILNTISVAWFAWAGALGVTLWVIMQACRVKHRRHRRNTM